MICIQCVHQVSRAYSFKQLCEQSDTNLRQYLGKPLIPKQCPKDEPHHSNDLYPAHLLLDNFGLDDSSDNSDDDDFKQDFGLLETPTDPSDEKAIAQRQLLKAAKMQKSKMSKKKMLAKNGGNGGEHLQQNKNVFSYNCYYSREYLCF